MSAAAAAIEAGRAVKKRKRVDPGAVVSTERLRDLYEENTRVQALRSSNDLLERLIMDRDGTDLRAVVSRIGALVQQTAKEFNALHERMQLANEMRNEGAVSSFMNQKLAPDDMRVIDHMFHIVLHENPNDDKARVAQLAIVFVALTIEVDVRQQLTPPPKHVDRFSNNNNGAAETIVDDAEQAQRERANQIQREPLTLFLKNDARRLMTRLADSIIDLRTYVSECVATYMAYKQAACRRVALQYYDTRE